MPQWSPWPSAWRSLQWPHCCARRWGRRVTGCIEVWCKSSTEHKLYTVMQWNAESILNHCRQVVFLWSSDTLSVLQDYQKNRLFSLSTALHQAVTVLDFRIRRAVLQCPSWSLWEWAGVLAKEGARKEQQDNSISYSKQKSIIRALSTSGPCRDDCWTWLVYPLSKQVAPVRLRTGNNVQTEWPHVLKSTAGAFSNLPKWSRRPNPEAIFSRDVPFPRR